MGLVAALHMGMANLARIQPQHAARHRHLAQIKGRAGAARPSLHHHGPNLWRAQRGMGRQIRQQGGQSGTGLKEFGRFGAYDKQVIFLGQAGVMHVHQLQHLTFSNHIGGFGKGLHDAHVSCVHHHLKRPRI